MQRMPLVLLLIGTLPGLVGCNAGEADLDDATRARVVALGDSAAMSLVRRLGGELNRQLATDGPAGAVQFCAGEAQALTDSVSDALGAGWAVKRTTLRARNPRNAPDSLESAALRYFHEADAAGQEREHWVQRTAAGDFRYYMPLRVAPMCLECHGERDRIDPAVRQVLETRYPTDEATGYREGDLRGVVRVTVPAEAAS
ncbi:MAG: DUF3365 domain-containing protein [Gemmatimonadota bacterium]